jgi:hypothetical protein
MNWTMPRPVLEVVALIIGIACLASFTLGIVTAPSRGRLPGERLDGVTGQPIQAQDATPLVDERIQGAITGEELTPEERAKLDEDKKAKAAAAALARAEAEKGAPVGPEATLPIAPAIQAEKIDPSVLPKPEPKPEEPPF